MSSGSTSGARGWRTFRRGFIAGFIVAIPLMLFSLSHNVKARVDGAGVTRGGGHRIVIEDPPSRLVQVCHGGCDDLAFQFSSGEASLRAQVFDAAGRRLQESEHYADGLSPARIEIGAPPAAEPARAQRPSGS